SRRFTGMTGFIIDLEGNDIGVGSVALTGVWILVDGKLVNISFLNADCFFGIVYLTFFIIIAVGTGVYVALWITIAEVGLGGENDVNIPLLEFCYKVVQEIEMVVVEQITCGIADFHIPYMYPEGIETKS